MIAATAGNELSVGNLKKGFMKGYITKDEYASALRAYQKSSNEMKSDMRVEAEQFMSVI